MHASVGSAGEVASFATRGSRFAGEQERRDSGEVQFCDRFIDFVTPLAPGRPAALKDSRYGCPRSLASRLPRRSVMAVLLLALFPILLMYKTRWAFACIGLAIVLLYRGKVKTATTRAQRRVEEDVYSSQF
jgi:hypothetical protein